MLQGPGLWGGFPRLGVFLTSLSIQRVQAGPDLKYDAVFCCGHVDLPMTKQEVGMYCASSSLRETKCSVYMVVSNPLLDCQASRMWTSGYLAKLYWCHFTTAYQTSHNLWSWWHQFIRAFFSFLSAFAIASDQWQGWERQQGSQRSICCSSTAEDPSACVLPIACNCLPSGLYAGQRGHHWEYPAKGRWMGYPQLPGDWFPPWP